jgi:hypothetical protein
MSPRRERIEVISMFINEKYIILKEEGGRLKIELEASSDIIKDIIEVIFTEFDYNEENALKKIELLKKCCYDLTKTTIVKCIDRKIFNIINDFDFYEHRLDRLENIIENLEILSKMFEISLEEMIRNVEVIDLLNYIKICKLYEGKYSYVFVEELNKNIIDKVLRYFEDEWESFCKISRGGIFNTIANILICLYEIKDKLTEENINKIKNFLLSHSIEHIINRRIKKSEHLGYIKAILSFLPDEIKGKYVVYFL